MDKQGGRRHDVPSKGQFGNRGHGRRAERSRAGTGRAEAPLGLGAGRPRCPTPVTGESGPRRQSVGCLSRDTEGTAGHDLGRRPEGGYWPSRGQAGPELSRGREGPRGRGRPQGGGAGRGAGPGGWAAEGLVLGRTREAGGVPRTPPAAEDGSYLALRSPAPRPSRRGALRGLRGGRARRRPPRSRRLGNARPPCGRGADGSDWPGRRPAARGLVRSAGLELAHRPHCPRRGQPESRAGQNRRPGRGPAFRELAPPLRDLRGAAAQTPGRWSRSKVLVGALPGLQ